jgi:hypothetical protein
MTTDTKLDATFSARLWRAWMLLQASRGLRMSQVQLGQELVRNGIPVSQATISGWLNDRAFPGTPELMVRLARTLSWGKRGERGWVDPGWLMFGAETEATGPDEESWAPEP